MSSDELSQLDALADKVECILLEKDRNLISLKQNFWFDQK